MSRNGQGAKYLISLSRGSQRVAPNSGTYTEQRANGAHTVYFIQAGKGGAVKIGYAKDVRRRMAELRISCPHDLVLIGAMPGGAEKEAELHAMFWSVHLRGEWFCPCEPLYDFIDEHASGEHYQRWAGRGWRGERYRIDDEWAEKVALQRARLPRSAL